MNGKGNSTKGYTDRGLHATVSIKDPAQTPIRKSFDFEVLIKNVSNKTKFIPISPWDDVAQRASRDSVCVMMGMTPWLFNETGNLPEREFTSTFLFGSEDVPGTTVLLKPGHKVRILGRAKVEGRIPPLRGHIYAMLGLQSVWWHLPDGERCSHEGKPFLIVQSEPGPEVDCRYLPHQ